MNIRFVSTLTAADENQIAPALVKAVGALLDQLPIAYTLRIETTGAEIFQHTHPAFGSSLTGEPGESALDLTRLPLVKS